MLYDLSLIFVEADNLQNSEDLLMHYITTPRVHFHPSQCYFIYKSSNILLVWLTSIDHRAWKTVLVQCLLLITKLNYGT